VSVRVVLIATVLALTSAASAAAAPRIALDRSCYYGTTKDGSLRDTISVSGTGFEPNAPLSFDADEMPLKVLGGPRRTDARGSFTATRLASPPVSRGEKVYFVNATAGDLTAGHVATITDFAADIFPTAKPGGRGLDPRRRVRISLAGWGAGKTIYLHFVPPRSRKAKSTVRIGRTGGDCGVATRRLRHFWPFRPRTPGTWRLQFDTKRRYSVKTRVAIPYLSVVTLR
jgi:hypothetical protein